MPHNPLHGRSESRSIVVDMMELADRVEQLERQASMNAVDAKAVAELTDIAETAGVKLDVPGESFVQLMLRTMRELADRKNHPPE